MAVRDLGVQPYAGERRSPAANGVVLLRLGLRRAWRSWMVKVATIMFWVPGVIGALQPWLLRWVAAQNPEAAAAGQIPPVEGGRLLTEVFGWSVWLVGFAITLGAGAGLVARDLAEDGLPFFLSKPVSPAQYLGGQAGAIALWLLALFLGNAAIVVLAGLLPTVPDDQRLEAIGLLFPALLHAAVAAIALATASVGVSAMSRSRALTLSAWAFVFVVPYLVAGLVEAVADVPWLWLASLPGLLAVVADAVFKVDPETALRVWHAAPILVLLVGGIAALALRRVGRIEVVT